MRDCEYFEIRKIESRAGGFKILGRLGLANIDYKRCLKKFDKERLYGESHRVAGKLGDIKLQDKYADKIRASWNTFEAKKYVGVSK